jgi:antitoxin HigA-1
MSTINLPKHPGCTVQETLYARRLSAKDLAKAVGVSTATISNLLRGKFRISVRYALKIEDALGLSAESICIAQTMYDLAYARWRVAGRLLATPLPAPEDPERGEGVAANGESHSAVAAKPMDSLPLVETQTDG